MRGGGFDVYVVSAKLWLFILNELKNSSIDYDCYWRQVKITF